MGIKKPKQQNYSNGTLGNGIDTENNLTQEIFTHLVRTQHVMKSLQGMVQGILTSIEYEVHAIDVLMGKLEKQMKAKKPRQKKTGA